MSRQEVKKENMMLKLFALILFVDDSEPVYRFSFFQPFQAQRGETCSVFDILQEKNDST